MRGSEKEVGATASPQPCHSSTIKPASGLDPSGECQAQGATPGPWIANNAHSGATVWRVETDAPGYPNDGYIIAEFYGPDAEANAKLTAASHGATEALKKAAEKFREYERMHLAKIKPMPRDVFYHNATIGNNEDAQAKADRNREMAEICEAALATGAA